MGIDWSAVHAEALDIFRQYLRMDTSNPPGNEAAAARYLGALLAAEGIECEFIETAPGREAVVARMRGDGSGGGALMLANHLDTVPADAADWAAPPFEAVVRDGRVYGRGAVDMKGTGVMHLFAMLLVKRSAVSLARDLVFLAAPDEETGSAFGVAWLVRERPDLFQDVAFALNKLRTPDPLFTSAYLLDPVSKIEAVDAKHVKFTLKNVFAPFLDAIGHQNALIMPKEIFDKYKDGRTKAAGTGPFMLDTQLAGSTHVLRRNPDYFGGQVYLDKVKYTVLPDAAAQAAAFRANQLDILSSTQKNQVEDIMKSNPNSQKFQLPGSSGVRLVINNARKPFDDVRVRAAISKAMDRSAIIGTFLNGDGRLMAILGANCSPWDIPQSEIDAYVKPDPAEAKKLLDAAGFANGFTTEWENSNASPTNVTVLELIQASLKPLKVDVKIKSVEYADWQKHANTQDFVAFMTGVRAATDPDGIFFRNYHPKSAQRWVELKNDEYKPLVDLIDLQRTELDPKKRLDAAQKLSRGLMAAHLAPGLYDPKSYVLASPRVQGYTAHGLSGQSELKHISIKA